MFGRECLRIVQFIFNTGNHSKASKLIAVVCHTHGLLVHKLIVTFPTPV